MKVPFNVLNFLLPVTTSSSQATKQSGSRTLLSVLLISLPFFYSSSASPNLFSTACMRVLGLPCGRNVATKEVCSVSVRMKQVEEL